jgi:hypothetical protein
MKSLDGILKKEALGNIANGIKDNWLIHLAFLMYIVLISVTIFKHEPWADEAQAWLLARDSSPFDLLFKNLRYEGHPPLWYLILIIPSKILPYRVISFISAIIAVSGVCILLYRSSFPKIVRLLLPFSYFIFYQYGVIARSYVLVPILLFAIARIYEDKTAKIYQFVALACLLANVSVFSILIALSIMLIHLIDLIKTRSILTKKLIIKQIIAYVIFAVIMALIAIILWQPEDCTFAKSYQYNIKQFYNMSRDILNEAMTEKLYISIPILLISLIWFWQTRVLLLYLLSTLSVLALFSIKYYNSWHLGFVFLTWVFVMWLSFDKQREQRIKNRWFAGIARKIVIVSVLIVIGFNVFWAASASIHDFNGTYSAGAAVARYIKDNQLEGKKIYATSFWSTSILPYFKENIFDNYSDGNRTTYWLWSTRNSRIEDHDAVIKAHPDLIIFGRSEKQDIPGYEFIGIFEGNLCWKDRIKEKNDFALFRKMESKGK